MDSFGHILPFPDQNKLDLILNDIEQNGQAIQT
jgi:hypothetical protein